MNTRLLSLLISIILIVTLFPSLALAEEKPTFSISSSGTDVEVGSLIEVSIEGLNLKDVYGFELRLDYDSNKLVIQNSATSSEGFSIPLIVQDEQIIFAHTKVGNVEGENGSLEMATMQFQTIEKGETSIQLMQVKLVDSKVVSTVVEPKVALNISITSHNEVSFSDIEAHWAKEEILRAAEMGWVNGFEDGSFRPQDKVTRAQFSTMFSRALVLSADDEMWESFKDAEQIPSYARSHVSQMVAAGIVRGYVDQTFRPQRLITRSEMAVMAMRVLGYNEKDTEIKALEFDDADQIQDWAYSAIVFGKDLGLIKGRGNNRFVPYGDATRAEAVVLILRILDYMEES